MKSIGLVVPLAAVLACGVPFAADGQTGDYPNRPLRLVVTSAPGGGVDTAARVVAHGLNLGLGRTVVVDNRPGGGGIIAAETVVRASPDGYTLFFTSSGHVSAPYLHKKLSYDVEKDFAPITQIGMQPLILVAHSSVAANNVKELIALSKAKPGGLTMGYSQIGTATHLAAELFKLKSGTDKTILSVGYKGSAAAQIALLAGEVQLSSVTLTPMIPFIKSGKIKALAVTGKQRAPAAPDTPTFEESGVFGVDITSWQGLLAPAATPRPLVRRLHAEVVKLLKLPESAARLTAAGIDPVGSTPEEFEAMIRRELVEIGKVFKAIGFKAQ